ncbi:SCO6745 family protein [Longispora albida]|uniref:SCO6745 family protein n=1 Tax=Longispora albida TaxID=203523 RepID=UPI00035D4A1A|nr:hypothetical protein [Longispora albida]
MTPLETATAIKAAVYTLGRAFSDCPKSLSRARAIGLTGWGFYVAGRAGVLGDVRPEVAAAAMGFVALDAVRDGWLASRRIARPAEIAAISLSECSRWGRERLGGLPEIGTLATLAEQAARSADATGMPLFAAWRAVPLPDNDPGARAAVALHLLREHRGAAHVLAIRVAGLSPVEAIVAGPDGRAGAQAFGWPPPYPDPAPLLRRRAEAERHTDKIAADAYRTLGAGERAELVRLLLGLRNQLDRAA